MEGKKVPILIMFTLNNVGKVERCNWIHLSTLSSQKVTWAVHILKSKMFAVQIYACLVVNQRGFLFKMCFSAEAYHGCLLCKYDQI